MLIPSLLLIAALCAGCTADAPRERSRAGEPAASYEVFPPTHRFGEIPDATLRNTGDVPLEVPYEFVLDRLDGGVWRTLPFTADPEYACDYSPARILHPGDSETQPLTVCDAGGPPLALPPGTYRVRKTVLTIPSEPGDEPVELHQSAQLDVDDASADIPGPHECRVLCISDTRVEPGQIVRVSFAPPRRFTWGVPSELHEGTERTIILVAHLTAWLERDAKITTHWPGEGGGYEDVGFRGPGSWRWRVPARLEPGVYSIVKHGIAGSVRIPIAERTTYWTVAFEVTG